MDAKWQSRITKFKKELHSVDRELAVCFVPGVFLVILGLMTCAAPDLLVAFIASFFLFCGLMSLFLAWKLVQLKNKAMGMLSQIRNTQVIVRTVAVEGPGESDAYAESKKVIMH